MWSVTGGDIVNNISAAHVLMSQLPEIPDGLYKTALEIAIEVLFQDAICDWHISTTELSLKEYLGLTDKQYKQWVINRRNG